VFPLTVTDVGDMVQVGISVTPVMFVVTWQVRFTEPENPLPPVTLKLAVFPVVAPGSRLMVAVPLGGLMVKVGSAVTVRLKVVLAVSELEVPVIVTVTGPPVVAEEVAVRVSTCVLAAVPAAKLAVTPVGRPEAVSATALAKPLAGTTVMI
jgi:hypothetical protein